MEKTIENDMETGGISGFMDMKLTHGNIRSYVKNGK